MAGRWRKLHNEELHNLYSSRRIIRMIKSRRMRWAGHIARMGDNSNTYRTLVVKPERKRPLGRPGRRWVNSDRMGWYGVDRAASGKGPVVSSCEHGNEPSDSIKCWEVLE
jgi:hypothetical protein